MEMIKEAIAALKDRTGSSSVAIAKYIEEKHGKALPPNFKKMLSVQLRASAAKGKLVKRAAEFDAAKPKKKAAEKPKKTAAVGTKRKAPEKKKLVTKAKKSPAAKAKAKPKTVRSPAAKKARKVAAA
uniref:Uncharacterized protein n=1 Tax=Aegilops tauschii TaxID=37682 RepID=N1R4K1_AEGTA